MSVRYTKKLKTPCLACHGKKRYYARHPLSCRSYALDQRAFPICNEDLSQFTYPHWITN